MSGRRVPKPAGEEGGTSRHRLDELEIGSVALGHGDGSPGWREFAPYARVRVAAAAPGVPKALRSQVGEPGVRVTPVGGSHAEHLEVWRRDPGGRREQRWHGECGFVSLLGRDAWPDRPAPDAGTTE